MIISNHQFEGLAAVAQDFEVLFRFHHTENCFWVERLNGKIYISIGPTGGSSVYYRMSVNWEAV